MPQGMSCTPLCIHKYKNCLAGNKEGRNTNSWIPRRLHCGNAPNNLGRSPATTQDSNQLLHVIRVQDKPSKTSSVPTQVITFLGMELNTVDWSIKWPKHKREAVQRKMKDLLQGTHTPRYLAEVVGALKAASPAWPTVHLEAFLLQEK